MRWAAERWSAPGTGSEFDAASELVREALVDGGHPVRVGRRLATRPRRSLRAALTVARLPRLGVRLSHDPAGRVIREQLDKRSLGVPVGRIARAALLLPEDTDGYLRGRHRQALRTNLKRAGELGISCRVLAPGEELARRSEELARARGWDPRLTTPDVPAREFVLAEDPAGSTLAMTVVIADVECAYLAYFIAMEPSRPHSLARYALSADLVERLIRRDVRILLVEGTLWASTGVQYFQRRLGFEPYNIRILPGPPRPR